MFALAARCVGISCAAQQDLETQNRRIMLLLLERTRDVINLYVLVLQVNECCLESARPHAQVFLSPREGVSRLCADFYESRRVKTNASSAFLNNPVRRRGEVDVLDHALSLVGQPCNATSHTSRRATSSMFSHSMIAACGSNVVRAQVRKHHC